VLVSSQFVLSHCSRVIQIDYSLLQQENNLLQVLRFHFKMDDLLSIFTHLQNAPVHFVEITVGL
jgi:hypothetical protein